MEPVAARRRAGGLAESGGDDGCSIKWHMPAMRLASLTARPTGALLSPAFSMLLALLGFVDLAIEVDGHRLGSPAGTGLILSRSFAAHRCRWASPRPR